MFGRLTAVRLKTAEDAFSDGRIDEAFEIATARELAGHRRVQRLLNDLFEPLLKRGQEHLLNRRFAEALADFDRAARCGVLADRVAEWRQRANEAMREHDKALRDRAAAIEEAQRRMAAGSLVGAGQALEGVSESDGRRIALAGEIDERLERASRYLREAREALRREAIGEAVERLLAARRLHAGLEGLTDMETDVVKLITDQAARSFEQGRLDRMEKELAQLGELGRSRTQRIEMEEALRLARDAARAVAEDHFGRAGMLIARLVQIGPKATWVTDAREHLQTLEHHRRALLEGPLGMIGAGPATSLVDGRETLAAPPLINGSRETGRDARSTLEAAVPTAANGLPKRLMLRIDGVGSFLLLRGERISVGHAGPGATADLQLVSDLSERHAEIVRSGEDYFVMSAAGVELAGRGVEHALLQDGDRIRLGRRVKLRFLRPSLKSNTAVLELGEGVRMISDARRAILANGPILIGGTRECHVALPANSGGLILVERGGELQLKPMAPGGQFTTVPMGQPFEIAGLNVRVQVASEGSSIGRVVG